MAGPVVMDGVNARLITLVVIGFWAVVFLICALLDRRRRRRQRLKDRLAKVGAIGVSGYMRRVYEDEAGIRGDDQWRKTT